MPDAIDPTTTPEETPAAPVEEPAVPAPETPEAPAPEAEATPEPEPVTPDETPEPAPEPEPVAVAPAPAPAQQAAPAPEPDELERDYLDAIETIKADEMLTDGQKKAHLVQLKRDLNQHRETRQRAAQETHNATWATLSRAHGLPADKLQQIWNAEVATLSKKGYAGEALRGAASLAFEQRVAAARKAPTPAPATAAKALPPKLAPTVTPQGGRVLPAANRHTPPAPAKKTAAEVVFEKFGPPDKYTFGR